MQVYEIDPADDDALNSWCAVNQASRLAAWPEDTPFTFDEVRAMATDGFGANRIVLAVAGDASGRAIGSSLLMLPTRDNVWTANVEIEVDPSHRRVGAGRALVAHAEAVARSEGSTRP